MTYILNIETSSQICSVAISADDKMISLVELNDANAHSTFLASCIQKALEQANITTTDLHAVAVSGGPGSYTGLRIGVSTAKGLCFGLDIPLLAIDTLQSLSNSFVLKNKCESNITLCPMLDARRMEVYTQFYNHHLSPINELQPLIIDEHSLETDLENSKFVLFGDGSTKCKPFIRHKNAIYVEDIKLSAEGMIPLSYNMFIKNEFANLAYYEPNYLKEFVAGPPRIKGLV